MKVPTIRRNYKIKRKVRDKITTHPKELEFTLLEE
jgi:hypothetical protein